MQKIKIPCGWCGKELGTKEGDFDDQAPTHGICDDCLQKNFPSLYPRVLAALEVANVEDIYKERR